MKKTVVTAALALLMLSPVLRAQSGINGKWDFNVETPQGAMEMAFDLKADKAGTLTGGMSMPMMQGTPALPISDGKITGKEVSFKVVMNGGANGSMTLNYKGKLEGDALTLTPSMEGMPAGGGPGGPGGAIPAMTGKRAAK